jgi:DNA repair protein RecO (recombination protein O)
MENIAHYTPMANRSWSTQALVLSLSTFGEGHREVLLLTQDDALIRAAVFGGAKSRLRAIVSPYQTGTVSLYSDPVKKSNKITDFDVTSWRQGIRDNLVRTWCAAVCVEIVTRSHGNAPWKLVNAFLDGISISGEDECRRGLLRFLWRFLLSSGINPEISGCIRCGENPENEVLFYSPYEDACVCAKCARFEERRFPLGPAAISYLLSVEKESPSLVRGITLNSADYADLRQFLFFLATRMIDGSLKTLDSGEGIL